MALPTQAKLLRALQAGEVRPVGSSEVRTVNVRVIAATNADLEQSCRDGRFREDLYHRLNVIRVDMPPLRERGDDIALLAQHFLHASQEAMGKRFEGIAPAALEALSRYGWRGNVRELANVMERAVAVAPGRTITRDDLPARIAQPEAIPAKADAPGLAFAAAKQQAIVRFERTYLEELLARHASVSAAAREAGLDRANLRRLLRRHGIRATARAARP
jgi:NtrC-family two-component system response regulator AlgB